MAKAAPRPDLGELVLAIAPGFEKRRPVPAAKLRLVPQQRSTPLVTLVSGPEVVLGRSPKDADFVAQFHPRNAVNDSRTMRIGRQQLRLTLGEDGIHILNIGTTNPSLWNGRVPQGERLALADDEVLLAGEFAVRILRTPPRGYSRRRFGAQVAMDDKTCEQGVAILPKRPSESLPCNTLWIFSECGLHLNAGEAFLSPWAGQAASPSVVWHRGADAFWIENNSSDARVTLNDIPLLAGSAAAIEVGDRIGLHDAQYLVQGC